MNTSENVSLHLGSFGINIADPLYSGMLEQVPQEERKNYSPRTLLFDIEDDAINNVVLRGRTRHLWDHNNVAVSNNGSFSCQVNNNYVQARKIMDELEDKIRKQVE